MRDCKQFTVLSFSAYKNTEECMVLLFNHAVENNLGDSVQTSYENKKKLLHAWVNATTDEGFTAIHFATYHGCYPMLKFLTENAKADISIKNKFGSSVMHVAAQGD
jgi:ankyrin repeat protein